MKKDILIAEDHTGIRMLLENILESKGFQVETAKTGKEAMDKLGMRSYDLIMLDYQLPIADGRQVLEFLEERKIAIPTIMMSGMTEGFDNSPWIMQRVQRIVSKPFNVLDVCTMVHSVLLGKTS